MSLPRETSSPGSKVKGKTHSPFSRDNANQRRFGITPAAFEALQRTVVTADATADRLRSKHPDMEVHYGDPETLEERRFPWLKKRRRW